jgi:hypothetical protein
MVSSTDNRQLPTTTIGVTIGAKWCQVLTTDNCQQQQLVSQLVSSTDNRQPPNNDAEAKS